MREEGIGYLADAGYFNTATAHDLSRQYDQADRLLNSCTDGRLLHGDLEGGHVFGMPDGRYSGMIDFGMAQSGDPRWDLARVVLWDGTEGFDALLDGYGIDVITDEDRRIVLPLYRITFALYQSVRFDRIGRTEAAREHIGQVL